MAKIGEAKRESDYKVDTRVKQYRKSKQGKPSFR